MLHHLLGINAIMTVKISDISLQCDTLIKEKSKKEKRHRQKLEHIFHFSVALTISIKKMEEQKQ